MKRIAIIVVAALALVYVADFCLFQFRKAGKNPTAFGTVRVQPFYAIPHKDGKAEYMFGDPQDQACVHALFPHAGYSPCWYIARQNGKTTSMVILPLANWMVASPAAISSATSTEVSSVSSPLTTATK